MKFNTFNFGNEEFFGPCLNKVQEQLPAVNPD